jgi:hypothetical protein
MGPTSLPLPSLDPKRPAKVVFISLVRFYGPWTLFTVVLVGFFPFSSPSFLEERKNGAF